MIRHLVLLMALAPVGLAQTANAAPALTLEQKEEFLKNAKVVTFHDAKKGITNTKRVTLSDGILTHDASVQNIDDRQLSFETAMGKEMNFRDTYKFNIAAYRLGKVLGLGGMIPPSVERSYGGHAGAWTWWVESVLMDDGEKRKQKVEAPDKDQWARQYQIMRVFDQLIYNTDRNVGNLLYDKEWRLWMIDHTRAFRRQTTLMDPKLLERCDRQLLANMKRLDEKTVKEAIGQWTESVEIKGLLARRDKIVAFFENKGEASLYDWLPAQ